MSQFSFLLKKFKLIKIISLLIVVTISAILITYIHQYSHFIFSIDKYEHYQKSLIKENYQHTGCIHKSEKIISILAGPFSLIILSIISIALLNYFPKNLFLVSIGLISSSSRLGTGFALFFNSLISRYQPSILNDEWLILKMANFKDIAIGNALLFFYLITFCVLFVITIRIYEAEHKIKWVVVISAVLIQIVVDFYLKNNIVEFILN